MFENTFHVKELFVEKNWASGLARWPHAGGEMVL